MNLNKVLLTENACYKAGKKIKPKGVMIHSTGANNRKLRRYVAPNDGKLGTPSSSHWNTARPDGRQVCVHAFIGELLDGTVATYQTLPWDHRGWHAGKGKKGSANDKYIGIEICEDDLTDKTYFKKVYQEAVELTASLCKEYNFDPTADGVIICHSEGYARGIASNHADVMHWFPKHGKSMDTFRADVAAAMGKKTTAKKTAEKKETASTVKIAGAKSQDKTAAKGIKYRVTSKSGLNVRSSASSEDRSNIIKAIPYNSVLTWYGYYTGDFYLVQLEDKSTGYVHKAYLKKA